MYVLIGILFFSKATIDRAIKPGKSRPDNQYAPLKTWGPELTLDELM